MAEEDLPGLLKELLGRERPLPVQPCLHLLTRDSCTQSGVEYVAQAVAQQVYTEDCQSDC